MENSDQLVVDDYHHAPAHPLKSLDLLFTRADLSFHVFVAKKINFISMTILDRRAAAANELDITSTETTLVGAPFTMLCVP
ncbi:MAG: hypothetical protein IH903_03960 [Proteobacteria bacterium]|nr:hypothetical protein [Pseudomonadota bacterium]